MFCNTIPRNRPIMTLKCRAKPLFAWLLLLGTASYISTSLFYIDFADCRISGINNCIVESLTKWSVTPTEKWLVILSYQRCGSSFVGSMFNFDPDAFYVFEPLDGLYSSLYGTDMGWNVPSDIVSYRNGSQRELPQIEHEYVSSFLRHLFECQVQSLPTQLLVHTYWSTFLAVHNNIDYTNCLSSIGVRFDCYRELHNVCPVRFDAGDKALDRCSQFLVANNNLATAVTKLPSDDPVAKNINNYTSCLAKQRRLLDGNCTETLRSSCSDSRLRVVKLVRGTMKSMQRLLEANSQLYVVHLVRDPRAVTLSRREFHDSARGLYTRDASSLSEKMRREAAIYCRQVANDVHFRLKLEQQFPGRLLSVNYEQLVDDPAGSVTKIYQLIGQPVPESVVQNFTSLALAGNRNVPGRNLTTRWKQKLDKNRKNIIDESCSELLNLYPQYKLER